MLAPSLEICVALLTREAVEREQADRKRIHETLGQIEADQRAMRDMLLAARGPRRPTLSLVDGGDDA